MRSVNLYRPLFIVIVLVLAVACMNSAAPNANEGKLTGRETASAAREKIVDGLSKVNFNALQQSWAQADRTAFTPLLWGGTTALGGNLVGLEGTLPSLGWIGDLGSGKVAIWGGHEGSWGSSADAQMDNDEFRGRLLDWLLGSGKKVGFDTGHGEWMGSSSFSTALTARMAGKGATISDITGTFTTGSLAQFALVVFGNPWGSFASGELDLVDAYVKQGGSILVLGTGWSWATSKHDPTGVAYPVNQLGGKLGFTAMTGYLWDPVWEGQAYISIKPISTYTPASAVVLKAADVSTVKASATNAPNSVFNIVGTHMALSLPTTVWAQLNDPVAALSALDKIYNSELELTGSLHAYADGDIISVMPQDAQGRPWWMHSGNPIVYQEAAGSSELVKYFNLGGQPGWGAAHEQGHNMVAQCNGLFVAPSTGEIWPNVFGIWSYKQNGWDWTAQMGPTPLFDKGHAYHKKANPLFSEWEADPFIGLGCFELIWDRYGWDGMKTFFTKAINDAFAGTTAGDDAAKTAYWVEKLSAAYGINFSPLIAHWGFQVSDASKTATASYAACDITW